MYDRRKVPPCLDAVLNGVARSTVSAGCVVNLSGGIGESR